MIKAYRRRQKDTQKTSLNYLSIPATPLSTPSFLRPIAQYSVVNSNAKRENVCRKYVHVPTQELFRGLVNCDYTVRAQRSLQAFRWVYYFRFLLNLLRSFTITCILCSCTSYRDFDTWIISGYFLGWEIYFKIIIFYVILVIP